MNLFTTRLGQIPFEALEEFLGLKLPAAQRIPEGPRIDYKVAIPQDLGDDVASFANGDGGLIFVGIRSDKILQNVPVEWNGLPPQADYGTQIVSRIVSTVHPRPDVEIGWATNSSGNFIYIIRVRPGSYPPYEYQQGNTVRIPIRVHDGKKAATVREIETLFRRREAALADPETRTSTYLNAHQDFNPQIALEGKEAELNAPQEWQRIVLVPTSRADLRLDTRFESEFERRVFAYFPDRRRPWDSKVRGDSFQVEAKEEGRTAWHYLWRIYRSGAIAFTGSIPRDVAIGDLAANLLLMCGLGDELFRELDIYGDISLGQLIMAPKARFLPQIPVVGRAGQYDKVPGIRVPNPQQVSSDRVSAVRLLDTSDLAAPLTEIADLLIYSLRELRGIRFDREKFHYALELLEGGLNRLRHCR